jgi:hypothetical protein
LAPAAGDNNPMAERNAIEREFERRVEQVKDSAPRFTYDREGRPGAIAAVRGALPLMERELFEAVVEDFECELAACREAVFRWIGE